MLINQPINFVFLLCSFISFSQENKYENGWYLGTNSKENTIEFTAFNEVYLFQNTPIISMTEIDKVSLITSKTRPYNQIEFVFTNKGALLLEKISENNVRKHFGFVFKDKLIFEALFTCKIVSGKISIGTDDNTINLKEIYKKIKLELQK